VGGGRRLGLTFVLEAEDAIRIRVTSRGGFTGVPSSRELDVDQLPGAQKTRVRELVDRGVWRAPEVQRTPHPRPQDFEYTVDVDDGDRKKTIVLHKSAASQELRDLIDLVEGS